MLLSETTKRVFVSLTLISFCFMFFGCEYMQTNKSGGSSTDEVSLKGEKITSEYLEKYSMSSTKSDSTCCAGQFDSIEVYSINTNSPKAKEIKEKIISDLKKFAGPDSAQESLMKVAQPGMNNGVIIEDNNGREQLSIPLENGSSTHNQYTYAKYNSSLNQVTSQLFYYDVVTEHSKSELQNNPSLADQTTADVEIKNEQGEIIFSKVFSKEQFKSQEREPGCFGSCINDIREGMDYFTWLLCLAGGPICAIGFTIYCTAHCIFQKTK